MKVLPDENSVGLCLMFYVWATIWQWITSLEKM